MAGCVLGLQPFPSVKTGHVSFAEETQIVKRGFTNRPQAAHRSSPWREKEKDDAAAERRGEVEKEQGGMQMWPASLEQPAPEREGGGSQGWPTGAQNIPPEINTALEISL